MTTRRGSFLLICIGMMTVMVIIGFALLRNIQLQTDSSTNMQRVLLAQSAAISGIEHATEQVLRDYNTPVLKTSSDSGATNTRNVTNLDGQWRIPFLPFEAPDAATADPNSGLDPSNTAAGPQASLVDQDVRSEHSLIQPYLPTTENYDVSLVRRLGMGYMFGRARYYEPNYYNTTPQYASSPTGLRAIGPFNTYGLPLPTSFMQRNASLPERNDGLWYDDRLMQIPSAGDPVSARASARYRLRYAVNVEDLSGHLLVNPLADMKVPEEYRTFAARGSLPAKWMDRQGDAFASMVGVQLGAVGPNQDVNCAAFEHVFLGRGWSGNVDVDKDNPAGRFPITFPRMYRYGTWERFWARDVNQDIDNYLGYNAKYWSYWDAPSVTEPPSGTTNRADRPSGMTGDQSDYHIAKEHHDAHYNRTSRLTQRLYHSLYVKGYENGGEPCYVDQIDMWDNPTPYMNALVGPQLSFWNTFYSAQAASRDGGYFNGQMGVFGTTPFGHALLQPDDYASTDGASYDPDKRKWYQGRVNTPFYVNILTAPPVVIRGMLMAYMPPMVKTMPLYAINFVPGGLPNPANQSFTDSDPIYAAGPANPQFEQFPYPYIDWRSKRNQNPYCYGRDLLVDDTHPAFAEFPAPARRGNDVIVPGEIVKPDYYSYDDRYRAIGSERAFARIYPGPGWNSQLPTIREEKNSLDLEPGMGMDDSSFPLPPEPVPPAPARKIPIKPRELGWGLDLHTWQPFLYLAYRGNVFDNMYPAFYYPHGDALDPVSDNPTVNAFPGRFLPNGYTDADWLESPLGCRPPEWWHLTNEDPNPLNTTDPAQPNNTKWNGGFKVCANAPTYPNSYWWDMYGAMAMAITVMRAQWQQYDNGYVDPSTSKLFPPGERVPEKFQNIRDLDRQFLAYLGESLGSDPQHPAAVAPGTNTFDKPGVPTWQLSYGTPNMSNNTVPPFTPLASPGFVAWTPPTNIRQLVIDDAIPTRQKNLSMPKLGPIVTTSKDRAKIMERVLNDFRMAFFGSSPEYSDGIDYDSSGKALPADKSLEFRPLDFDGDGIVHCSCYQLWNAAYVDPVNPSPLPAGKVPAIHDPTAPVESSGRGPKPDPRMYFSPSGCFFVGRSHYFRMLSRGELWDNRLNTIVNETTLESAIAIDPEGDNPLQTQTLFQRWHFDRYQGQMDHVSPGKKPTSAINLDGIYP